MPLMLDISGFEALFEVNYQKLCSVSYRIVKDREIAENLVQDVFANLWEKRAELFINTTLKDYLFQCTITESIDYIRKYRTALSKAGVYAGKGNKCEKSGRQADVNELSYNVDDIINDLPDSCRLVFVLSRYEHLSYKVIARKLDISVSEVEQEMVRALNRLRNFLLVFYLFLSYTFIVL